MEASGRPFITSMQSPSRIAFNGSRAAGLVLVWVITASDDAPLWARFVIHRIAETRIAVNFFLIISVLQGSLPQHLVDWREGSPMVRRHPQMLQSVAMGLRGVACIGSPAIPRMRGVKLHHDPIPRDLGDDGGGCDRHAKRVA